MQAHIMNDEATRKYLHGVSRLIKGVQGVTAHGPLPLRQLQCLPGVLPALSLLQLRCDSATADNALDFSL